MFGSVARLFRPGPVAAVASSADLVAWSRLGSAYSPADLDAALESRAPLELRAIIRPGELDARADRVAGVLRVTAIHQDVPFGKAATAAIGDEIKDLAHWLQLDLTLPGWRMTPAATNPVFITQTALFMKSLIWPQLPGRVAADNY